MLLHEAVKNARKDLGLSQDKLSELAGIQRRQLAKLEAGGNVTLATLRKVLAQLPNLESFTLDAVSATVKREIPPAEKAQAMRSALQLLGTALQSLLQSLDTGQPPDERARQQVREVNQILDERIGLSPEEVARRHQPRPPQPPMTEEQLKRFFSSMAELAENGLQRLDRLKFPEEEEEDGELPEEDDTPDADTSRAE
ncbi:MAG TPA: helix-turn-helix transcriptional regulator [Thermoanaerobaculia bacterium]